MGTIFHSQTFGPGTFPRQQNSSSYPSKKKKSSSFPSFSVDEKRRKSSPLPSVVCLFAISVFHGNSSRRTRYFLRVANRRRVLTTLLLTKPPTTYVFDLKRSGSHRKRRTARLVTYHMTRDGNGSKPIGFCHPKFKPMKNI